MEFGTQDQLILVLLLLAVATLLILAPIFRVPYPIFLVLGGLALGFVPGMPTIELPPEVVLVAVLPPLLYVSAFFTSLRELRANAKPVGVLAIGLVLVTMTVVAVVAHTAIDDLSWGSAFVLGAIVSPTDPIAATAIARRLGVPRRIVSIVEGESLVNDGTALVFLRAAVTAVVAGSFSFTEASWRFVWSIVGGVAVGLAVGFLIARVRRRLDNPPVELTISLMTGYFAFIPAAAIQASGVLAVVTAGIFLGWRTPELTSVQVRLSGTAMWEILSFVLNALLFTLVGLQLPGILDALTGVPAGQLAWYALLVFLAVVLTRVVFVPLFTYLPRVLFSGMGPPKPLPHALVISWSGMRGAVSLAAALALPLTVDGGGPFPHRDLIIFLTFCVILGTLVVQGLTLPAVIRLFKLEPDHLDEKEDAKARIKAADAAVARLDELLGEDWVREDTAERFRGLYGFRRNRFASRFDADSDGAIEERSQNYQRLRRELLEAERGAIVTLQRDGVISNDVMLRLLRDLDLEDARLDV
jgi:CPA1 family monovalent cation:H+ antiporter